MKKIPTLFKREYANHRVVDIKDEVTPGCEDAFQRGLATVKLDGTCCAIIGGVFYRRYDAKKGKKPPEGAIPCCDPDPITGHHPHWLKVDKDNPQDKWHYEALLNTVDAVWDGTYEAIGVHFQGNPYRLRFDELVRHGEEIVDVERTFDGIKAWLETHNEEGLVFWLDGEPVCKIKRSDFGFKWPVEE